MIDVWLLIYSDINSDKLRQECCPVGEHNCAKTSTKDHASDHGNQIGEQISKNVSKGWRKYHQNVRKKNISIVV